MKKIKNIIFDLGGVLLNIDENLTIEAFRQLGFYHFDNTLEGLQTSGFFTNFEIDVFSVAQFREELQKLNKKNVSDQEIDTAWGAMLLDFPADRVELLLRLKKKYRLFLLSNTNRLHYEMFNRILQLENNIPSISALFHKDYYSFDLKLRKPNPEIYRTIMKLENMAASEILFVDDREENTKAAAELGWNTIHLKKESKLTDIFADY